MPFAVIAGHRIEFTSFVEEEERFAGETVEMFDQTLGSTERGPSRRRFNGTSIPYHPDEIASLRADLTAALGFVTCAGDGFDGADGTMKVRITSMPYERSQYRTSDRSPNPQGYEKIYTFSFEQASPTMEIL